MEITFAAAPAANNSRMDTPPTAYGRAHSHWFSEADTDASWEPGAGVVR